MVRFPYQKENGMIQNKPEARDAICQAIAATLQRSGRELPQFSDQDKPVKNYDGFDSQCGIEVTVELEERLGVGDLGSNIFVEQVGKAVHARSLAEIVDVVLAKAKTAKGGA